MLVFEYFNDILLGSTFLISVSILVIIVFARIKLNPLLGNLISGVIINNSPMNYIFNLEKMEFLGEFGVIFLLFSIGLELSVERLKVMRKYIFGLGSLQILFTSILFTLLLINKLNNSMIAVILGTTLSLSSTALIIRIINESRNNSNQLGRLALAILIMQDFAIIPILVVLQLIHQSSITGGIWNVSEIGLVLSRGVGILIISIIAGRLLLRPFFRIIFTENVANSSEVQTALTLLMVLSASCGTYSIGLSFSLGAFVAGVLVSETDFRLEAEKYIDPFKNLFLGLFFMIVGMHINMLEFLNNHNILYLIGSSLVLIFIKTCTITVLCIIFGFNKGVALNVGLLLSQGSEFTFVVLNVLKQARVLDYLLIESISVIIIITMMLTPILASLGHKMFEILDKKYAQKMHSLYYLNINAKDLVNHVIIAGFGKVGKMVARILSVEKVNYIILDINHDVVKNGYDNGFPVFRGDAASIDVLIAAGINRAATVIFTMNNDVTIKKALRGIKEKNFDVNIIIRLKNLKHAKDFYADGANIIVPEENEIGLILGGCVLKSVGFDDAEVYRISERFRLANYIIEQSSNNLRKLEEND